MALLVIPGELNPAATPVNLPFGTQTVWGSSGILPPLSGWATVSGSPSTVGNSLVLPIGSSTTQQISAPSSIITATWTFSFTLASLASGSFRLFPLYQSASAFWVLIVYPAGTIILDKYTGSFTTLITGTWTPDTNQHVASVSRDSSGNWQISLDGAVLGTGTDTFLPSISSIQFYSSMSGTVTIGPLQVS